MLVLFGWSWTKNAFEVWYWNLQMCCNFDVQTHMLGLTWASRLYDLFYHLLCIHDDKSVLDNLITTLRRKGILKSIYVNKDTMCRNLDVKNICFLCFIIFIDCQTTLKQKKSPTPETNHLYVEHWRLVTGYTDHFCTHWEQWKMLRIGH